ncbi:hypothetical protein PTSG_04007 [Salpingoeca rosetta]|uniref:Aminotransferase class I/classII large domain-containing protein n=1 Tax=Salpingoeca rosetta (strain ATCC 50818 / BSB-021) TaxID=946362 RepID=F2U7I2_SALR5|nr:uncharacterized protein PTSG_04007 [Salpingoeca rosetta]EGD83399.1 hypothetical protein PTSG_04007 [Salpingoeca rosetta]|eukprot:XP_004994903.1 hypothetical protein PTSG_04007 [Salpingoeca rosetta]
MKLDMATVEECYQECIAEGAKAPVFIYTNPHNPSGTIFCAKQTEALVSWCLAKQVHLISDEIYAMSIFTTAKVEFTSVFDIAHGAKRQGAEDLIHIMWGGSKDLGLNGFRIGVLLTRNQELKKCLRGLAYGFSTPAEMQEMTAAVIEDEHFFTRFLEANAQRLTDTYSKVVAKLRDHGVKDIAVADGAMFVYFKMPGEELSLEEERFLWQRLVRENRVMVLPGLVFEDARRGWFRICVSANPLEDTLEAVDRIFKHPHH